MIPDSATNTAPPIRMTRSDRLSTRAPPAGPDPAGGALTTVSGTRGSSQRPAGLTQLSRSEPDDSVVVRAAAVHHAGPPGLLVHEQVEVVTEQFHLEQRVVDRHRFAVVFLLPDDVPRLVVELLDGQFGEAAEDRPLHRRREPVRPVQRGQAG